MNNKITLKENDYVVFKSKQGKETAYTLSGKDWNGRPISALEPFELETDGKLVRIIRPLNFKIIYDNENNNVM